MNSSKHVALVAHDNMKQDLVEWVEFNHGTLLMHTLVCTGTTGRLVEEALREKAGGDLPRGFEIRRLKSGPLGGDQQLGALICLQVGKDRHLAQLLDLLERRLERGHVSHIREQALERALVDLEHL